MIERYRNVKLGGREGRANLDVFWSAAQLCSLVGQNIEEQKLPKYLLRTPLLFVHIYLLND